jgi:probable F420-dependent oxidoreductase
VNIGGVVPVSGANALYPGVTDAARTLETAGFDSLWVIDHLVMPKESQSWYPFSDDGKMTWSPDQPFLDSISACAAIAGVTSTAEIGTAVLVLPIREPVTISKQAATIDVISGGRFILGLGAGWLREEFEALRSDFETRGDRLTEAMGLIRSCWTGQPEGFAGSYYSLPTGILCYPTPVHDIPLLVGGNSPAALRRSALFADGWLGLVRAADIDLERLKRQVRQIHKIASAAGRNIDRPRIVIRIIQSQGKAGTIRPYLDVFRGIGITDLIVDTSWDNPDADVVRAQLA